MAIVASLKKNLCKSLVLLRRFYSITTTTTKTLEQSIKSAIETKTYHEIPNLLLKSPKNPNNPFSFLSSLSQPLRIQIIDEILQSFIHLRPRSRTKQTLDCLLSHTFQNPNPNSNDLSLPLAILQRSLRSGCLPPAQIRLFLSTAWLRHRRTHHSATVSALLNSMRSVGSGYRPDLGTCNYLMESLCLMNEMDEAGRVLKEMGRVGCNPDSDSYGFVIGGLCGARRSEEAVRMVKEMVGVEGLVPRQGTVVRVVASMRVDGKVRAAAEMVEELEREGIRVGFEGYEVVVEGCLERREFVVGAKVVVKMVERGFVPYVRVRQRLVEGLVNVGEGKLACFVRQKLGEVRS